MRAYCRLLALVPMLLHRAPLLQAQTVPLLDGDYDVPLLDGNTPISLHLGNEEEAHR
jgi:hypothetical protein